MAHTFRSLQDILAVAKSAEKHLSDVLKIPDRVRGGARFIAQSGEMLPASYKYAATTSTVTLQRGSGAKSVWFLVDLAETRLFPKSRPAQQVWLTETQDREVVRQIRAQYSIIKSEISKIEQELAPDSETENEVS